MGLASITASPPEQTAPKKVQLSIEQAGILAKEESRIRGRLNKLVEQKDARKLAAFWLENYGVLTLIGWQHIGQDMWDQMQIACNFCDACKKADNAPENSQESIEAEQAIVKAKQDSYNRGDLLHFTLWEEWCIKRTRRRSLTSDF